MGQSLNERRHDARFVALVIDGILLLAREEASELRRRPLARWVFRDVAMENPTGADLQHQEDVDEPERDRDRHEEIARQCLAVVVSQTRAPRLRRRTRPRRHGPPPGASDRPRRDDNAQSSVRAVSGVRCRIRRLRTTETTARLYDWITGRRQTYVCSRRHREHEQSRLKCGCWSR
jgi:hypothetical protein